MPDLDGFETATLIRERRRSAHTPPIIFISAISPAESYAARGYLLGAAGAGAGHAG
jgi:CheY-like chemotaxis protein